MGICWDVCWSSDVIKGYCGMVCTGMACDLVEAIQDIKWPSRLDLCGCGVCVCVGVAVVVKGFCSMVYNGVACDLVDHVV